MPELTGLLLAWLSTYAIHGTLLLAACALATWRMGVSRSALKERLWRFAFFGAVLTATLQTALAIEPFGGRLSLELPHPSATPAVETAAPGPAEHLAPAADAAPAAPVVFFVAEPEAAAAAPAPGPAASPAPEGARPVWPFVLAGVWALGAALGLMHLAASYFALRRRLAGRTDVRVGAMPAMLEHLAREAGLARAPRLTACRGLESPVAKGLLRREICVPTRALSELSGGQQEAMLAHELAHLLRRDPAWMLLVRGTCALFFFQPLGRLARARMLELAELACDDWAVQRTRRPLDLAQCLTEIADWIVGPDRGPAVAMTSGSRLGARVERLLAADGEPLWRGRGRRVAALLAVGLVAVALGAPGVAARATARPAAPGRPELVFPVHASEVPEAPADFASTRTVHFVALSPLVSAFAALDGELRSIERELGELSALVSEHGLEARFADELAAVERRLGRLRDMRARWATLLHRILDSADTADFGNPTPGHTARSSK